MLNKIEICPRDMIGYDQRRLVSGERVARGCYSCTIQLGKDDLDAKPDETGKLRTNIIRNCRIEERDGQERGQRDVCYEEVEKPRCYDQDPAQGSKKHPSIEGFEEGGRCH